MTGNHGFSGALKNAIDFLFREWNDKVLEDSFAVSQAARGSKGFLFAKA